ncbi:unnamed protein product [Rotaria sp. Silwood1]|nr:unnamed protein product [Rotaria sp. Silwood1]
MGCNQTKVSTATTTNNSTSPIATIPVVTTRVVNASSSQITTHDTTTVIDREQINLESHQLVWCDVGINDNENIVTIENLRKIVDYTKLFDSVQKCQQYLENQQDNSTTFLVTSGHLGESLVPKVHHLQNVLVIFLYCHNKEYYQQWASKYEKVKHIHTVLDHLLDDLKNDVQNYLKSEKNGNIISSLKQENSIDGAFEWWLNLTKLLVNIPYPENCRLKLVTTLKDYYKGKESELKILEEFEKDYKSEKAIWWYTREAFVYRLVNRAARQKDLHIMFLFGFIVQDLYHQLKQEHEKFKISHADDPIIKSYRGQIMLHREITALSDRPGPLWLRNTSFLSTSLHREISCNFLQMSTLAEGLERVLLEIVIDTQEESQPFADISHLSEVSSEAEILFMMGTSIFIDEEGISYDEKEKLWKFNGKLGTDWVWDDQHLQATSKRNQLAHCLRDFYKETENKPLDEIHNIFNELLNIFPLEKWITAVKASCLGAINLKWPLRDHAKALKYYEKSLSIWFEFVDDDELQCYIDIVHIYEKIRDIYDLAIAQAQSLLEKCSDESQQTIIHVRLSWLYIQKANMNTDDTKKAENLLLALRHKKLEIQTLTNSSTSSDQYTRTASLYNQIANLNEMLFNYEEALTNYSKSLEIQCEHPVYNYADNYSIATTAIVRIYIDKKHDYTSALKYQLLKHEYILKKPIDEDYEDDDIKNGEIADSHVVLANIYREMHQYVSATKHLTTGIELYKEDRYEDHKEKIENLLQKLETLKSLLTSSNSSKPT